MKDLYTELLETALKMNEIGFKLKDFKLKDLKSDENEWFFSDDNFELMVYFNPSKVIRVYPDVKGTRAEEWDCYYDSFMAVRDELNRIVADFDVVVDALQKKFPNFKIVKFGGWDEHD